MLQIYIKLQVHFPRPGENLANGQKYIANRARTPSPIAIVMNPICVAALAVASPFTIIGAPNAIAGLPTIQPMQVEGVDDEILFLTEIKVGGPGSGLPKAHAPIDVMFICVLACQDMPAMAQWLGQQLDAEIAPELAIHYRTISRAFDLPANTPHRITTASREDAMFLEFDQYPRQPRKRSSLPGLLVPGVSIVTQKAPDLDAVPGP